jgi:hypothetical protein
MKFVHRPESAVFLGRNGFIGPLAIAANSTIHNVNQCLTALQHRGTVLENVLTGISKQRGIKA